MVYIMNVLSLFDGMSCGQIALKRVGISFETYYASEVDKHAITVTQANHPETIQLGDVTCWREWDVDWSSIGLIMGGSPCQGFSFAGKGLAFDDPRSRLFFVFVEIVNHVKSVNPNVKFLLENVRMKKEYLDLISDYMSVEPVFINSALVSAQNRQRFYWANWNFSEPEDRGLVLADILEEGVVDRVKSYAIDANYWKGGDLNQYFNKSRRQVVFKFNRNDLLKEPIEKSLPILESDWRGLNRNQNQNCVVQTRSFGKGFMGQRMYAPFGKSPCLMSNSTGGVKPVFIENSTEFTYRKLTPIECERLQTVPDNYTNHVSNTQRYRMLGNGWTVDVIAHILSSRGENDLLESRWQ